MLWIQLNTMNLNKFSPSIDCSGLSLGEPLKILIRLHSKPKRISIEDLGIDGLH
jgi:hypothetical protein